MYQYLIIENNVLKNYVFVKKLMHYIHGICTSTNIRLKISSFSAKASRTGPWILEKHNKIQSEITLLILKLKTYNAVVRTYHLSMSDQ